MSREETLLEALQAKAGDRRRVSIDDVWSSFRRVVRGTTGQSDARAELASLLTALNADGSVGFPKSRRGWDTSVVPPLPKWIALPQPIVEPSIQPDPQTIAWPPELLFAMDARFDRMLGDLLAIKTFLSEGGRRRPMVPLRERSLQIWGNEKRLDALRRSALFREGYISLELLRCYEVAPPLVFEAIPNPSAPVLLVIENLHTYESFRRWNRIVRAYAAIVYGQGSEFRSTVRDLPRACREVGASRAEYFGDLDREGLCIPVQARRALADSGSELVLEPASRWYALLVSIGRPLRCPRRELGEDGHAALAWLGVPTGPAVAALLDSGRRLAQEDVGTEQLTDLQLEK